MPKKPADSPKSLIDPDDGQEWTEEMFASAVLRDGDTVIPRRKMGRPKSAAPKAQVTLRLDPDVLESFRAGGAGWQSRINATLRASLTVSPPLGSGREREVRVGASPKHSATKGVKRA
jgi:uncharacterized protein (DUF4415 family)